VNTAPNIQAVGDYLIESSWLQTRWRNKFQHLRERVICHCAGLFNANASQLFGIVAFSILQNGRGGKLLTSGNVP